jgi:hypothetical protein
MEPVALLNHGLNFVAPALWMALLMPVCCRIVLRNWRSSHVFTSQVAINFIVSAAALIVGLLIFGHDGKMLTYLAMVVLSASTQWFLVKGWRG